MRELLSRFPLKVQIGAIVAAAVLVFAVIAATVAVSASAQSALAERAEAAQGLKDQAQSVAFSLLDARRREKDFLARRTDAAVQAHAADMAKVAATLTEMARNGGDGQRRDAQDIARDAVAYGEAFAQAVALQRRIGYDENSGLMGSLRASVHAVEQALKAHDELRLAVLMLQMRRHEKDFLARLDVKYQGEMGKRAGEFADALAQSPLPEAVRTDITAKMAAYHGDFGAVVEATLALGATTARLSELYAALEPRVADLSARADAATAEATAERQRVDRAARRAIAAAILAGTVALVALGWLIARGIYGPLCGLAEAMKHLAADRLEVEVPSLGRADEVGAMAAAVQVFKDNAREAGRLRRDQEERRRDAEQEKLVALRTMADTVERETRAAVERVALRTGEMEATAGGMTTSARAVSGNSRDVAAAAAQALANAESVASASEELTASISEIARQVTTAGDITGRAVRSADAARHTIGQLAEAVAHIGEVAHIIADIAGQTNLLALNATIEAARAGDAGKGFAVVAGEVKTLANQTAKATDEISRQIAAVQQSTQAAVAAVGAIAGDIQAVESISSAIAAAIEQQGAATREIARNVGQTSDAARNVAGSIALVSDEAAATGERAGQVQDFSADIAQSIDELRLILVRTVRTATREVDRRALPRFRLAARTWLETAGARIEGTLENCSEGGATLVPQGADLLPGQCVTLTIEGLGEAMPAVVMTVEHGRAHLHLDLDDDTLEAYAHRFRKAVAGLEPVAA